MSARGLESLWVWIDDPAFGPLQRIGTLAQGDRGVIRFSYERSWLESGGAFALDPRLRPADGEHFAKDGNFGVFVDSCPDRWGQILMRRREALAARDEGRKSRELGSWDFLQGVQDITRMGALRFSPPDSKRFLADDALAAPPLARLAELQALATELSRTDIDDLPELRQWLAALLAPGSSLGGARPKANLVDEKQGLWIAKFPAANDTYDVALWEMLLQELALDAGIEVSEARLWKTSARPHTFLTRRFDRNQGGRRFFCSAMTLLEKSDGEAASYLELAEFLASQGDPERLEADLAQLFRRVVFNVAVGNRDDHLRNHGFLRAPGGWALAPAYDLNPAFDKAEHVLALDEHVSRPDLDLVLETGAFYRLSKIQAKGILDGVVGAIGPWKKRAKALGMPRSEVARGESLFRLR